MTFIGFFFAIGVGHSQVREYNVIYQTFDCEDWQQMGIIEKQVGGKYRVSFMHYDAPGPRSTHGLPLPGVPNDRYLVKRLDDAGAVQVSGERMLDTYQDEAKKIPIKQLVSYDIIAARPTICLIRGKWMICYVYTVTLSVAKSAFFDALSGLPQSGLGMVKLGSGSNSITISRQIEIEISGAIPRK